MLKWIGSYTHYPFECTVLCDKMADYKPYVVTLLRFKLVIWFYFKWFYNFLEESVYTVYALLSTHRKISCWLVCKTVVDRVDYVTAFFRVFCFNIFCLWHCTPIYICRLLELHKIKSLKSSVSVCRHVSVPAALRAWCHTCGGPTIETDCLSRNWFS